MKRLFYSSTIFTHRKDISRENPMNKIFQLLCFTLPCVFIACQKDNPVSARQSLTGTWRAVYTPQMDSTAPGHAIWNIVESNSVISGVIIYTDPSYTPCGCPRDTVKGAIDNQNHFSFDLGEGKTAQVFGDSTREIVFTKLIAGNEQPDGAILNAMLTWAYTAKGYVPPGSKEGTIFSSWSVLAVKQ